MRFVTIPSPNFEPAIFPLSTYLNLFSDIQCALPPFLCLSTPLASAFIQHTQTHFRLCNTVKPPFPSHATLKPFFPSSTYLNPSLLHPPTLTSLSYIHLPRSISPTLIKPYQNKITFTLNKNHLIILLDYMMQFQVISYPSHPLFPLHQHHNNQLHHLCPFWSSEHSLSK